MNSVHMDRSCFLTLSFGPGQPVGYTCRGRMASSEFIDFNSDLIDPNRMIDDEGHITLERAITIAGDVLLSISDTSGVHRDGYGESLFRTLDHYVLCIKKCREQSEAPNHLKEAGEILVKLIKERVAPKRFWLHIIDVAVWCHNVYAKSLDNQDDMYTYSIYDKDDVYALMISLESTMHSYTGVDALMNVREGENIQSSIKELRLKLLGVLTSSYMQNNHDSGCILQPKTGGSERLKSHRAYDILTGTSVKNYK